MNFKYGNEHADPNIFGEWDYMLNDSDQVTLQLSTAKENPIWFQVNFPHIKLKANMIIETKAAVTHLCSLLSRGYM